MNVNLVHLPLNYCFYSMLQIVWLSVTFVCQCTFIEFLVKEKHLKCNKCCMYAFVPPVLEGE